MELSFDDSSWETGPGLFGYETTTPYPYPFSTTIPAIRDGGPLTTYFRLPFIWNGQPGWAVCGGTAYVDDGAAFYLNGVNIGRLRLPEGPLADSDLATNTEEPAMDSVSLTITNLIVGTNLLAVEVHQSSTNSSDIVFGLDLQIEQTLVPPLITNEPGDQVVMVGDSAAFNVVAGGTPPLTFEWHHNGEKVSGGASPAIAVTNSTATDAGTYYVVVSNAFGVVTSQVGCSDGQLLRHLWSGLARPERRWRMAAAPSSR